MNQHTTVPTHLFVGSSNQLHHTITKALQRAFCKQQTSDCFCSECRKIKQEQHPDVIWVAPEKNYVLSDLAIIFEKIRFSLPPDQSFFFILKKAHLLSPICANRLLKTLEEPPPGYRFFLLTNNEQSIIPTIRSRCLITHVASGSPQLLMHPLLSFFIDQQKRHDAFTFKQELKNQRISEQESVALIYDLMHSIERRVIDYQKKCLCLEDLERLEHNETYRHIKATLTFLQKQLLQPPQPGSATLFWKKLFLTFP